jgi:hypothetical protein
MATPDAAVSQKRARTSDAQRARLLVLEPHPHARFGDGVHHRRGVELGGVVADAQPLPDHVGRDRLHAGDRLEAALEDHHLVVAVEPFDAEHRLRVHLADRARHLRGGHQRAPPRRPSWACRSPCSKSASTW